MKKRLLGLLLSAAVIFTSSAVSVQAVETDGAVETEIEQSVEEETVEEDETVPEESVVVMADDVEVLAENSVEHPVGGLMPFEITEIDAKDAPPVEVDLSDPDRKNNLNTKAYDHSWEKYANYVVYNQLDDARKEVWDAFNEVCLNYMNATGDVSGVGGVFIPSSIYTDVYDMMDFLCIYKYSNPQYFFLANGVSRSPTNGGSVVYFLDYENMRNASARQEAKQKYLNGISEFKAEINKRDLSSDEAKIRAIHDVICEKVVYNYDSVNNKHIYEQTEYTQSSYSTFVLKNTVCSGYAQAFATLSNDYGVDCMAITSPGHAYCRVKAYDSWYNIDPTWDDQKWGYGYWYYLKSDIEYSSDPDDGYNHTPDPQWHEFLLPCTQSSTADYDYAGITAPASANKTSNPKISLTDNNGTITATITGESGAYMYYSLDGEDPHSSATRCLRYKGPFTVSENAVVKAIAIHDTRYDSNIVTINVRDELRPVVTIKEKSLTLDGEISLNIYASIPSKIRATSGAYAMVNGQKMMMSSFSKDENVFSFKVSAKNMQDLKSLYFCDGSNQKYGLVNSVGSAISGNTYSTSVVATAEEVLSNGSSSTAYKNLAKSLIDYGGYAQDYLNYNTGSITKKSSPSDLNAVTASKLSPYVKVESGSLPNGVSYAGSTLMLTTNTAIRHYFTGNVSGCTFYINGTRVSSDKIVSKDGTTYIELAGIAGYNLDKPHTLKVTGKNSNNQDVTYQLTYSALSYANTALEKSNSDKLKNVSKTLYNYNAAVKAYFNK